ncbi:MAG: hypothetical protein QGH45_00525, partial [Myxococcota bacterium]|nr:hypothetical protein [Myxococcota bacterium]
MPQVIPCPSCGRPNGPKYTRCMYCGTELPERDEPATADAAEGSDERSEQFASTMDPKLLASLPPKLRAQIQAETDPPREPPAPAQFVSPAPPPLGVDPALAEEELEATITGEHASVGDLLSGEHAAVISASGAYAQVDEDDVQTDQYRSVAVPGADSPLLRGRGPFGPRDAAARVLLVPDPGYRQNLPWLRVRLNNLMGLDAYTANLYLQREFPVFLEAFEEMSEAWALEDDLIAGGMRVLVLTREMVEGHREAFYADNAEVDATSVLFSAAGEAPLQVERLDLEAALLGEIKPLEQPDRPLVERTFWRNKARESRSFEDIQHPFWLLELSAKEPVLPIRIRQDRFDFRCLGDQRRPSSLLNLKNLPAFFAYPGAEVPVDDLFRRVPRVRRQKVASEEAVAGPPEEEVLFSEYALIQTLSRRAARGGEDQEG